MRKKNPLKAFDVPVILLAAALTLIVGGAAYKKGSSSSRVIIRGPDRSWIFPLNSEEQVLVSGSAGETLVEIRNGRAAIVSSPCSAQTCVAAGELQKNGQWAACLPNKVFLLIEGAEDTDAVDAAAY